MIMIIVLPIALILSFFGHVSFRPFMIAVALAVAKWTGAMDCGCNRSCGICCSSQHPSFPSFLSAHPSTHTRKQRKMPTEQKRKKKKELQSASSSFMLYFDSYLNGDRCFPLLNYCNAMLHPSHAMGMAMDERRRIYTTISVCWQTLLHPRQNFI